MSPNLLTIYIIHTLQHLFAIIRGALSALQRGEKGSNTKPSATGSRSVSSKTYPLYSYNSWTRYYTILIFSFAPNTQDIRSRTKTRSRWTLDRLIYEAAGGKTKSLNRCLYGSSAAPCGMPSMPGRSAGLGGGYRWKFCESPGV